MGNRSWGYVIEGYPRTLPQAEDIENQVGFCFGGVRTRESFQLGRLDLAILIDCTEQYCKDTLKKRYQDGKEDGSERAGLSFSTQLILLLLVFRRRGKRGQSPTRLLQTKHAADAQVFGR